MNRLRKPYILERLVYIVIWLIVFLIPVVIAYWPTSSRVEHTFSWEMVIRAWVQGILPFFLLFCLNNFWLAPYLLLRKKYVHYAVSILLAVSLFIWVDVWVIRRGPVGNFFTLNDRMWELRERRPGEYEYERSFTRAPDYQQLPDEPDTGELRRLPGEPSQESPREWRTLRNGGRERRFQPFPGMMIVPVISRFLIAVLMVGFNIAIKLLFKSLRDEEAMKELERRKLQSELEYLKYQINPHFFMNTLNNIHALVDVNTEQARKAIIELSKMMRYVLYEANQKTILLSREVQFLSNYIELMKLRYINKVNVRVSLPGDIPPVEIPPLLYISFIENAFKHGVTYQNDSLIYVTMQIEEGNLIFNCSNTNNGKHEEQHKGIGLDNIQKRLKLLYDNNYTLSINESHDSFNVLLIIPFL